MARECAWLTSIKDETAHYWARQILVPAKKAEPARFTLRTRLPDRVRCTFVVSAYDRPEILRGTLISLALQSERDFEVIVTDNSLDGRNAAVVADMRDERFRYEHWSLRNCYKAANHGATLAQGEYLCFPSDDNYYTPGFLETMLKARADLIYCDMVYDPRACTPEDALDAKLCESYRVIETKLIPGWIDKGGFLIRRSRFVPFPWRESLATADGFMIRDLLKTNPTTAKVKGVLWVHN